MNAQDLTRESMSEAEIDRIVIGQADDDAAWEEPVRVRRPKSVSLSIPAGLAARAAFLAQLHRNANVEEWLAHVIKERVELEEAALAGAKREFASR